MDRERLRRVASKHFGVFTRAMAAECGYSPYQIRRRVNDGEWQSIVGSALCVAGLTVTPSIRDRAAQLSVPGSVLAGPSAARVFQLPISDERPCLYIGEHGGSRLVGVRLLYETPADRDIVLYKGLPATSRACAVVDCLRLLPEPAALELLERALQRRWIEIDELARRITQRGRRHGTPKLERLLELVRGGERSTAERRLTALLRQGGIRGWRANVEVYDAAGLIGVVDVAFATARVAVEVDGWAFHTTPQRFERDRQRQNRLVAAGWTVLRFTWRDLTQRPEYVLATIGRQVPPNRSAV